MQDYILLQTSNFRKFIYIYVWAYKAIKVISNLCCFRSPFFPYNASDWEDSQVAMEIEARVLVYFFIFKIWDEILWFDPDKYGSSSKYVIIGEILELKFYQSHLQFLCEDVVPVFHIAEIQQPIIHEMWQAHIKTSNYNNYWKRNMISKFLILKYFIYFAKTEFDTCSKWAA